MGDGIVQDVLDYNVESFCKAFFNTTSKCDIVDNNLLETFNGWILDARYKPIISMLEEIRIKVMKRLRLKRRFDKKWISNLAPKAQVKLDKNKEKSYNWFMEWNEDDGMRSHAYMIKMIGILWTSRKRHAHAESGI